jgi:ring-opening amidohydrolase-like protein
VLRKHGVDEEQVKGVPIVWSGGTDGVISPHATIFATIPADEAEQTDEPRLTVGFAMSENLLPEEIGYTPMIEKVAAAVKVAMERAGITDPADVHYVQTKTPLLTIHTIRDAKSRGKTVWTEHTHESMDLSNGAPAWASPSPSARSRCRPTPTSCTTASSTRRSPRAPRVSSSTRRRSSSSATRAASAGATGSGTR